eukprot:TRINITY_DN3124_c0_g3_i1.p1 TRINITY_DN3124_c0_g3~~TRINITY_DN3124_c0_g3_i1.p1  ORF type:complete len:274 (-),score=82.84 TRINITY_DN3124_c0_g3_i1:130-951(-)
MGNGTSKEWLYSAVEAENIEEIKRILKVNPHYLNEPMTKDCKTTPLLRSAWRGSMKLTQFFIEAGADVNLPGPKNDTALMWACIRGHKDLAKFLIEKGARVDIESTDGLSPIDYTVIFNQYDIGLFLVKEGYAKPRKAIFYQQYAKDNYVPYVDYDLFLEHLELAIPTAQVPKFNIKPPKEEVKFNDPVIDPRESWQQFFKRVMNFEDPPIVERSSLPPELQPQNRKLGKLRELLNLNAPAPAPTSGNYQSVVNSDKSDKSPSLPAIEIKRNE